jgi:hypothetical protein
MFDLKAKIVVNQYQIPYLIEKELTDLEKRPDYRNGWEDRTTFDYNNAVWFKEQEIIDNAFGNEIELRSHGCGVSSGKKKQNIKKFCGRKI